MTETTITSVPVTGGAIDVRRQGRGGPTLVLLHYWGGSARTWDAVVDRLPAERDVVRFDQRGWSSSRRLPGPYDLDRLADDVAEVVARLGLERYVLAGHSMGGKVSQLVAARRPSGLAGIALVAPAPPRPPAMVTPEYRQVLAHAYDSAENVGQALDHVLTAVPLDPAVRDAVVRDSLASDADAREEWPLRGIAADVSAAAGRIDVPVLVLAGENDQVEPPSVLREHLLPHLPDARFEVVAKSGHLLPLEAPDAVASALEDFAALLGD
ncbi:alpha/beta fold hydrolase [Actinoallomurus rhizosphaericola]|uniref:alpha/beta fold hydrolase n=1 Tax=Actinoallomurus rhizosphaericola TaxID=2952536 RepID=UPI0020938D73|nr:alpha/beta hydrolase [Actinoallomurus rhizosphaericola]MCO5994819.1 alpha/beta hydrolase [Actinoallomurus rhizosphaericola]